MSSELNGGSRAIGAEGQEWDGVAAGWKKWWPVIEPAAQCVSERMLDMANVVARQRVLDIATGIGEPALLAARRVGADGVVIATDFSAQMLEIARERANSLDLTNVSLCRPMQTVWSSPIAIFIPCSAAGASAPCRIHATRWRKYDAY